jgi:hypothetical protein
MSWASALEASPFDLQEVYGSRGTEPGIWKTSTKMLGKVLGGWVRTAVKRAFEPNPGDQPAGLAPRRSGFESP